MPVIGDRVRYTVLDAHKTTTKKGDQELKGSVHHPALTEFAGIVGAVNEDGTCALQLFVPNKPPTWIDDAMEGAGAGQFVVL
jgi:hypothetical protein